MDSSIGGSKCWSSGYLIACKNHNKVSVTTEATFNRAKPNLKNFNSKLRNWLEVISEGNKSMKDQIEQMESIWIILQYFKNSKDYWAILKSLIRDKISIEI